MVTTADVVNQLTFVSHACTGLTVSTIRRELSCTRNIPSSVGGHAIVLFATIRWTLGTGQGAWSHVMIPSPRWVDLRLAAKQPVVLIPNQTEHSVTCHIIIDRHGTLPMGSQL